jgi:hypothetical protein
LGVLVLGLWQQMTKPDVVYKDKKGTLESALSALPALSALTPLTPLTTAQQAAIIIKPEVKIDPASNAVLLFKIYHQAAIRHISLMAYPKNC